MNFKMTHKLYLVYWGNELSPRFLRHDIRVRRADKVDEDDLNNAVVVSKNTIQSKLLKVMLGEL